MSYYPLMLVESIRLDKSTPMTHWGNGQLLTWYKINFIGVQESDLEPKNSMVLKVCADCPANELCYRIGIPRLNRFDVEVPGTFVYKGNDKTSNLNCIKGKIILNPDGSYTVYGGEEQDYRYRNLLFKAFNITITQEEREKLDFQVILGVCSKLLDTEAVNRGVLSAREFENWAKRKYPNDAIVPTVEVMKKLGVAIPTEDIQDFFREKNQELHLELDSRELSVCARTLRQALDMIAKPHLWKEYL